MHDLELDIGAQLCIALETLNSTLTRQEAERQKLAQAVRQLPLSTSPMSLDGSGDGVIDDPAQLRPGTGFIWSVRRLTVWGFTAGTAVACMNSQYGEPVAPFAVAGSATFGRGELLMHPGDRLVITAAGITGGVQVIGAADCFPVWYLPHYIG